MKKIVKSTILLSVMTLFSRIAGLLREMTKAAFLGTSSSADAFAVAFMIPNLLRRLFAENSISVAFIPTYREMLVSDEKGEKTREFLSSTLTLLSFLTALIVAIGIFLSPLIVPFFFKNREKALVVEAALLTRIMFPYLFFISIAAFFQGILNGKKIFLPSAFTPILFNLIVVSSTVFFKSRLIKDGNIDEVLSARAMSIGVFVGGLVQLLFQLPFVKRSCVPLSFCSLKKAFTNSGTKKVISLVIPTIFGMACYQINDLVSTALAGKAGGGVVSSLQYSLRLQELFLGIFAVSISTVMLPDLTGLAKKREWESFNSMLITGGEVITLLTVPVTFFSLIYGREIISLLYKSGSFNEESVKSTLRVFRFHIASLFFIALNRILSPAFYAQSNTILPTNAAVFSFTCNIIGALILSKTMGGGGIALALSLSSVINSIFLLIFLKRMPSGETAFVLPLKSFALYTAKITLFSIISSLPVFFLKERLTSFFSHSGRILKYGFPLLSAILLFSFTGCFLLFISRDKVALSLFSKVKNKLKR